VIGVFSYYSHIIYTRLYLHATKSTSVLYDSASWLSRYLVWSLSNGLVVPYFAATRPSSRSDLARMTLSLQAVRSSQALSPTLLPYGSPPRVLLFLFQVTSPSQSVRLPLSTSVAFPPLSLIAACRLFSRLSSLSASQISSSKGKTVQ